MQLLVLLTRQYFPIGRFSKVLIKPVKTDFFIERCIILLSRLSKPNCLNVFSIEFIEGVSQFSVKGDKEQKLRCKSNSSDSLSKYGIMNALCTCLHI